MFEKIDKFNIRFKKNGWSESDVFFAACLDFKPEDDTLVADVRVVCKKAMNAFLKNVFPHFINHGNYAVARKNLFGILKTMYDDAMEDFMANHYWKAGYKELVGKDLWDHQKTTLAQSIHRLNNLWALDMGTGKTLTAATMSKITDAKRTVVICPAVVKWNWIDDMTKKWGFNALEWSLLDSKKSKSKFAFNEKFVVLNYEQVGLKMDYLLRDIVDHVIIDESHYLKNHKAQRSKNVASLIKQSDNPRVTMLTGTPVTNRINDFFNYLKIAKHPLGDSLYKFKEMYALMSGTRGGKINGAKNIPDLRAKTSNLMIRLRSEDCMDLPKLIINKYYMEVDDLSNEYKDELALLKGKKERFNLLEEGKEKQKMIMEIQANIHTLNRLASTSKVKKVLELVKYLNDLGHKTVVFSGYTDPLMLLERKLGDSCVKIDGSVSSDKRRSIINRFIEDPKCMNFLGNMQAAGIGINLVNAQHVIFMNFPFTPDQLEQSQKRLHRGGQTKSVTAYYTIARGTIDEHIYDLIIDKSEDINALIDGDHDGVTNYANIASQLFNELMKAS